MDQHFLHSSFREKLIEHVFIGELLKLSWLRGECSLEVAKPEVDSRGYDVIIERAGVVRHIQLKTSAKAARAASQKIHVGLAEKPSGCVVWIQFDPLTLELGQFLFFGDACGRPLPDIAAFKISKHTKRDAEGKKAERPSLRNVPKGRFRKFAELEELFDMLFKPPTADESGSVDVARLQQGLHETILGRLKEFRIERELRLPSLTLPLPSRETPCWYPIDGMYGGFSYWSEGAGQTQCLVVESWSRVEGGSGQRHEVKNGQVRLVAEGFV